MNRREFIAIAGVGSEAACEASPSGLQLLADFPEIPLSKFR